MVPHTKTKIRHRWCGGVAAMMLAAVLSSAPGSGAAAATDSAVFLMYHRFGEGQLPSTNIGIEQFEAHLEELMSGGYTVLPVPEIIAALRNGTALPDRTVGITIDDAYASAYEEAWPRLRAAGLPFTVFVSTDPVEQGVDGYMTWAQIRELHAAGVTIGNHTGSHLRMAASDDATNRDEVVRSQRLLAEMLGTTPRLFAFPFGEASLTTQATVRGAGLAVGFGQHSGVANRGSDMMYLPRFAMNEEFGGIDRFRLVTQALALDVSDLTPANPTLMQNPPAFGFTLAGDAPRGLACYASGQGPAELAHLGPRVEVRVPAAFAPGRARINCTAPAGDGRWYWLGMQYYVPAATN